LNWVSVLVENFEQALSDKAVDLRGNLIGLSRDA
jgi:hypothetical protein